MPMVYVNQDQLADRIEVLEKQGLQVTQVLQVGNQWAIMVKRGPGRPPKETRGTAA